MRLFLVIFILLYAVFVNAQPYKRHYVYGLSSYNGTYFNFDNQQNLDSLKTSMPQDIIKIFNFIDSIKYAIKYEDYKNFVLEHQNTVPIQKIMKYYYQLVDWNPMQFVAYKYSPQDNFFSISMVEEAIVERYLSETNSVGNILVSTSYCIYHVKVHDTARYYADSNEIYNRALKCYCELLDIFKGDFVNSPCFSDENKLPITDELIFKKGIINKTNLFCFDIYLDWPRGKNTEDQTLIGIDGYPWTGIQEKLIDKNDVPWIKANHEYILFLIPQLSEFDKFKNKYYLRPNGYNSLSKGMYLIENGIVQDPSNDFGLGLYVPYNEFITKIKQTIDEIRNYAD